MYFSSHIPNYGNTSEISEFHQVSHDFHSKITFSTKNSLKCLLIYHTSAHLFLVFFSLQYHISLYNGDYKCKMDTKQENLNRDFY